MLEDIMEGKGKEGKNELKLENINNFDDPNEILELHFCKRKS